MTSDNDNLPDLSEDLLRGASEIAKFIFGDPSERRKVYHLANMGALPVFKMGAILCARKSSLLTSIDKQERQTPFHGPTE